MYSHGSVIKVKKRWFWYRWDFKNVIDKAFLILFGPSFLTKRFFCYEVFLSCTLIENVTANLKIVSLSNRNHRWTKKTWYFYVTYLLTNINKKNIKHLKKAKYYMVFFILCSFVTMECSTRACVNRLGNILLCMYLIFR